jgi:long-chain acyl-CoA synthetase
LIDISSTLAGRQVILTGGNGFLGKVLLALLLDRYPDLSQVHLLIRPKREQSPDQRFETEVLDSPPFQPLLKTRGRDFLRDKITVWAGDAAQPNAGVEQPGWADGVDLIIHCAGLVEFFPPVDQALRANADSVVEMAALAERTGAKLLHVSTCYVAGKADGFIEETDPITGFYPNRTGPNDDSFNAAAELESLRGDIRRIHESSADDRDKNEQLIALGRRRSSRWGWVNTYTYSKSLGEQILAETPGLDWTIVRPAIVESSWLYPFPGWIEGGRTAAPLVLMALSGMTDWPARPDIPLEIIPVDQVAAAIIGCAALLLAGEHRPVYQLGSADTNPFALGPLIQLLCDEARYVNRNGSGDAKIPFWLRPSSGPRFLPAHRIRANRETRMRRIETSRRILIAIQDQLKKTPIPANGLLSDWIASHRTLALQAHLRDQTIDQYMPFILDNRYIFETRNIRDAYTRLSPADREKIPWGPEAINWPEYWRENQIEGIRKWVQPEAVRNWSLQI